MISKDKSKVKFAQNSNSTIIILMIVGLSWIMNIGWLRIIFLIPMMLHDALFYYSTRSYHHIANRSSRIMFLINSCIYGTFLLGYILLPDMGDTDSSYRVLFGLIKNHSFINIASYISLILLVMNLALIIIQIIYTVKVKRDL